MKEKYLQRIQELLGIACDVKRTDQLHGMGYQFDNPTLDFSSYYKWISLCQSFLSTTVGKGNVFYQNFSISTRRGAYPSCVEAGIGILTALKIEIESDLLVKVHTLALAEVFSDFLEMAEHLLESGLKDPAAFLVGAVLEDGLRKLAKENKITLSPRDDISSVNNKLAANGVYDTYTQRQIHAWKKIRNSAAHGKFDEYDEKEVQSFFTWTKGFLEKHLS